MASPRRILYQLVAPMEQSLGVAEMKRRQAFLARNAAPGFEIEVRSIRRGAASIESAYDAAMAAPHILESLRGAATEGIDGAIIGCFSDPALDAAREILDVPVVGPGMSGMLLALQLGERFSIISPNEQGSGHSGAYVRQLGLSARYASTRGMGLSVVELARGDESALERIARVGRRCIEEDGADVLVMGCMSMAFLDLGGALQARIGVPVVSPVIAALKSVETMLVHGVAPSAATWPAPPAKPVLDRGF